MGKHHRAHAADAQLDHGEHGAVIHWAGRYDLLLALTLAGRGRRLRARLAELLELQPGQRVLDLGCGTGTLALSLTRQVAPSGEVVGVDASPEMVAVASAKAERRGLHAHFQVAIAQALPFPDGSFDAAISSLVVHHLPPADRSAAVRELVRVVRPGSRLVLADVQPPSSRLARQLSRRLLAPAMHSSDLSGVADLLTTAGVQDVRIDATPVSWIGVVHGRTPLG